jgi:hypothetical protein
VSSFRYKNIPPKKDDSPEAPSPPKRQFINAPEKVSPSQRYHGLLVTMYWLGPVLAVLLILAAAIFAVVKLQPASRGLVEGDLKEGSVQNTALSPVDMETAQFLETYLEAVGGRDVLTTMKSAIFEGRLRTSEGMRNFQLLVRDPDQGALIFKSKEGLKESRFINGEFAWEVLESADGTKQTRRLDNEETRELMLFCRLHDPLRELALGGPGTVWSVRETVLDGVACYQVDLEGASDTFVECFLDKETLYLLATKRAHVVDGEQVVRRVVFGDYRMTSWIIEPFQSTVYHDDDFVAEREFRSIRVNPDLDASRFEIPEELR